MATGSSVHRFLQTSWFRAKRRIDSGYWVEIGAAWANKDGKGFSPRLNLMPVGEADIVVREISEESETDQTATEGGAQ